jgi:hypothetical protein
MLDFVPNHMGLGHPWIEDHPDYFVQGTELDRARAPQNYTWVKKWRLQDQLSPASYEWNGDDLQGWGLYLDMAPWQACAPSWCALPRRNHREALARPSATRTMLWNRSQTADIADESRS